MDKFTEAMTKSMEPKAPDTESEDGEMEDDDEGVLTDLVAKAKGKIAELQSILEEISKNC